MSLQVITTEIMLDKLIIKVHHQLFVCIGLFRSRKITFYTLYQDVQLTVSNDDQYFVFEDVIFQIMLCFSRDTEVD